MVCIGNYPVPEFLSKFVAGMLFYLLGQLR